MMAAPASAGIMSRPVLLQNISDVVDPAVRA
jgi:hypothetical protein